MRKRRVESEAASDEVKRRVKMVGVQERESVRRV